MQRVCAALLLVSSFCSMAEEVKPVEPEVRKAFEEALGNLPEPLRKQVEV